MPDRDVVACNAMIAGCVQNGNYIKALGIFEHMLKSEISPDTATLLTVLSAVAQLGHLENGVAIHCYLEENGFPVGVKLGVALIDMYAKCGSLENAKIVFENIEEERSVDHWNAMIGGLAIHGLSELAFGLLLDMERHCVEPDDITFIGVLNACGHVGHVGLAKEVLMCFELLRRVHKLEPKMQHYGCVVDFLGRAGLIEEARRFISGMPIEPNDVVWRTLLSACKNDEKFSIGKPVAKNLIRQDSCNSSAYVLLSNMYDGLMSRA
nr:pentatricopeptide repeat-containing protein At2g45350, chloroplastic-like [Ziziphus jujuba var. spinosa]